MRSSITRRRFALGSIIAVLVAFGGCNDHELANSKSRPEALAQAVIYGLEAEDREALEALLVTRDEHLGLLWDHLPESNQMRFEVARELNMRNTREGLAHALSEFGGQEFELVRIEFTDDPEVYETFTLHRGTRLWVRRLRDGKEGNLPILDVVLELNGRWKLMNFEE